MLNEFLNLLLSLMCEPSQLIKKLSLQSYAYTYAYAKTSEAFRCRRTELGEACDSLESGGEGYDAIMSKLEKGIRRILDPGESYLRKLFLGSPEI